LQRWRAQALSEPQRERTWTAEARLEAVITTASMDESSRSGWCREHGVYPRDLEKWRAEAVTALADPGGARATPEEPRRDRRRIKLRARELRRKDRALAESAALLVLAKKLAAVLQGDEEEWSACKTAARSSKRWTKRIGRERGSRQ